MANRLIRINDVCESTGLSKSTLYAMIAVGSFPASIKLSERCVAWNEGDVQDWIQQRIDASRITDQRANVLCNTALHSGNRNPS